MDAHPAVVGRYEVQRLLGKGAMGEVYLARDPTINRPVAIKVLRIDNDEFRRRFHLEVTSAGVLRHRHVVTIFDSGEHEGLPYLAMEYIPGETLAEKIGRRDLIPLSDKLRYVEELCEGLAHAHKCGIVHRDVKPANIVIDAEENAVKILDFGIARVVDSSATITGGVIGTPGYMAPEQIAGGPIDARTDVFAVGALFYELLTYRRPFPGTFEEGVLSRILNDDPVPVETLVPDVDPRLAQIVRRALQKEPARRYDNLRTMAADIRVVRQQIAALSGVSTTVMSPAVPRSLPSASLTPQPTTSVNSAGMLRSELSRNLREMPTHDASGRVQGVRPYVARLRYAAIGLTAAAVALAVWPNPLPIDRGTLHESRNESPPAVSSVRHEPAENAAPHPTVPTARGNADPSERLRVEDINPAGARKNVRPEQPSTGSSTRPAPAVTSPTSQNTIGARTDGSEERRHQLLRTAEQLDARGDGQRALASIESALDAFPGDAEFVSLLKRLYGDAEQRASAAHASALAALAGRSGESIAFGRAEQQRARGHASDTGSLPTAIRALWAAAEFYDVAAAEGSSPARRDAKAREQSESSPSDRTERPPVQHETVRLPPGGPTATAPVTVNEERAGIERALNEYRSAYEALDINRLLRVYPGLPDRSSLERAFADAREVRMGFSKPKLTLTGPSSATAALNRTQEFIPRIGRTRPDSRTIVIELQKTVAGLWVITDVR